MYSPQVQKRLQQARQKYIQHARQRRYDQTIFVPLETPRFWLCAPERNGSCHLTTYPNPREETPYGPVIGPSKEDKHREENEVYWYIYHKDHPLEQIGSISLFQFTNTDAKIASAMLGYTIHEGHRGKGYMSEALGAILEFAFEKLGLQRVEARVRTTNDASRSVVQRAGFKVMGVVRQGKWALGDDKGIQIMESEVWILGKEDWEKNSLINGKL
jgi:RimJ/RimL family protein N-acetyltransferase